MTARTEVESVTGIMFSLSATLPDTYDAAGYQSTDIVWTEVGEVEDVGGEDATKSVTPFIPVKTGDTTKVPGSIDYGKRTITLGHLPGDAGQVLMQSLFRNKTARASVKLEFPDGELRFLHVIVTKFGMTGGKAGEVARITSEIDICKAPVSVLP